MGNQIGTIGARVRALGDKCPSRNDEEQLRRSILAQIRIEQEEKDRKHRFEVSERRAKAAREAAEKAQLIRKEKEEAEQKKREEEQRQAVAKQSEEQVRTNIENVVKPMLDALFLKTEASRVDGMEGLGSMLKDEIEQYEHDVAVKIGGLESTLEQNVGTVARQVGELKAKLDSMTSNTELLLTALGDPEFFSEEDVATRMLAMGAIQADYHMKVEELRDVSKGEVVTVSAIKIELEAVNRTVTAQAEMLTQLQADLAAQREESKAQSETDASLHMEENKELTMMISTLADTVQKLEDRIYALEYEDDEVCSECSLQSVTPIQKKTKPELLEPVREKPLTEDEQVLAGELIPRHNSDRRVDMINWEKLRIVQPKVPVDGKYSKWDEIFISTLTKPPTRAQHSWRVWKESIWHWALELRKVNASFAQLGRQVIASCFPDSSFEGEHSVACSAGQSRDLVQIMSALDVHFCPHTRTVQSRLESDIHNIRRLDMQSPSLFFHLLGIVFRRETEINGGDSMRSETARVDRALKALFFPQHTEQLLRSMMSQSSHEHPFNFIRLEKEVDTLAITDFRRYKPDPSNVKIDKYFPPEQGERDVLQELLEHIGERLSVDTHGHHSVTNSYYQNTSRGQLRSTSGTGLLTAGNPIGGGGFGGAGAGNGGLSGGGGQIDGMIFATPGTLQPNPGGGGNPNFGGTTTTTTGKIPVAQVKNLILATTGSSDGRVEKDANGKEFWIPPKLTEEERQKRIEASNRFKLKKDPQAGWCKAGEYCRDVLTTGECKNGMHLKKEFWRMITQFERNFPEKATALKKKKADKKKAEGAATAPK
eukprot:g17999.t1